MCSILLQSSSLSLRNKSITFDLQVADDNSSLMSLSVMSCLVKNSRKYSLLTINSQSAISLFCIRSEVSLYYKNRFSNNISNRCMMHRPHIMLLVGTNDLKDKMIKNESIR